MTFRRTLGITPKGDVHGLADTVWAQGNVDAVIIHPYLETQRRVPGENFEFTLLVQFGHQIGEFLPAAHGVLQRAGKYGYRRVFWTVAGHIATRDLRSGPGPGPAPVSPGAFERGDLRDSLVPPAPVGQSGEPQAAYPPVPVVTWRVP